MVDYARLWWEGFARDFLAWYQHPIEVEYEAGINEERLQLIGPVAGKRVLEIGRAVCVELGAPIYRNHRSENIASHALVL
jgi:hypothetical protein